MSDDSGSGSGAGAGGSNPKGRSHERPIDDDIHRQLQHVRQRMKQTDRINQTLSSAEADLAKFLTSNSLDESQRRELNINIDKLFHEHDQVLNNSGQNKLEVSIF